MKMKDAVKRIESLPPTRDFFLAARDIASKGGLIIVAKAAERALLAFRLLPERYFDEKNIDTYTFHATFPDYRQSAMHSANDDDWQAIKKIIADSQEVTLYYHVPYCAGKCRYCSFPSFAIKNAGIGNTPDIGSYLNDLWQERALWDELTGLLRKPVRSIYIGGGTPTALPPEALKEVLQRSKEVNLEGREITCEMSPGTLTEEKLEIVSSEASRLSIGIQSMNDDLLRFIERDHDSAKAEWAIKEAIRRMGNVNVDLIYALPGPDGVLLPWLETLERISELSPHR